MSCYGTEVAVKRVRSDRTTRMKFDASNPTSCLSPYWLLAYSNQDSWFSSRWTGRDITGELRGTGTTDALGWRIQKTLTVDRSSSVNHFPVHEGRGAEPHWAEQVEPGLHMFLKTYIQNLFSRCASVCYRWVVNRVHSEFYLVEILSLLLHLPSLFYIKKQIHWPRMERGKHIFAKCVKKSQTSPEHDFLRTQLFFSLFFLFV